MLAIDKKLKKLNLQTLQNYQPQQPNITMGNSVSNKFENNASSNAIGLDKKAQSLKPDGSKPGKNASDSAKSGGNGWFGGIFSKLSMKPKNQMILPEDKDPTVSLPLKFHKSHLLSLIS